MESGRGLPQSLRMSMRMRREKNADMVMDLTRAKDFAIKRGARAALRHPLCRRKTVKDNKPEIP